MSGTIGRVEVDYVEIGSNGHRNRSGGAGHRLRRRAAGDAECGGAERRRNANGGNRDGYRRTYACPQSDGCANRYPNPNRHAGADLDGGANLDADPGAYPNAHAHAGADLDAPTYLYAGADGYPHPNADANPDTDAGTHCHAPAHRYALSDLYTRSQKADERSAPPSR